MQLDEPGQDYLMELTFHRITATWGERRLLPSHYYNVRQTVIVCSRPDDDGGGVELCTTASGRHGVVHEIISKVNVVIYIP